MVLSTIMVTTDTQDQLKRRAQDAADELRSAASAQADHLRHSAEDKAAQLREMAEISWEDAKNRAQDLLEEGEKYVRENPTKSVMTAVGVGFVLGLLFRR